MEFIYARISKSELDTQNQIYALKQRFPDAEVITEIVSGAKDKPALNALVERLNPGDVLAVYALDRLGRRASQSITLVESLTKRGIKLVSIREGLDFSTVSGELVGNIMLSLAQTERRLISERTKNCLARLKAEGKKLGAPRKFDDSVVSTVVQLREQGKTLMEISSITGVSYGRVHSFLKQQAA